MEKRKIQAKPKLSAEAQEAMIQSLQQSTANSANLQQTTVPAVNVQQIEEVAVNDNTENIIPEIVAVKLQQNVETATKISNDTAPAEKNNKTQRITVDMPTALYEQMKDAVDVNGQTIKGFVVNLVKSHFQKIG